MQLKPGSKDLLELNNEFLQIQPLPKIISISESIPIHALGMDLFVVPPEYSNIGVGEFIQLPEKNHHSICKPKDML